MVQELWDVGLSFRRCTDEDIFRVLNWWWWWRGGCDDGVWLGTCGWELLVWGCWVLVLGV